MTDTTQHRLQPGDTAPAFTLQDQEGRPVSLRDSAGKHTIVYFYPAASTPGCTTEACDFRDSLASLAAAGTLVPRERLEGRTSVLIGHSGVGKSTLLNALIPGASRATGSVNDVTGRGRHTSSSALALRLPGEEGGWVIDTPGVRSFGLGHVTPEELLEAFTDLAPLAEACPRGCTHAQDAPDCALDGAVERGEAGGAGPARLASYRRLDEVLRRNNPWEA